MNILYKIITAGLLLGLHTKARGQTEYECQYWFDNNLTTLQSQKLIGDSARLELEVDRLERGIHALNLQVVDSAGVVSSPHSRLFFNNGVSGNPLMVHYWFNSEGAKHHTFSHKDGKIELDVSSLKPGLHTLYYQVEDVDKILSSAHSAMFFRTSDSDGRRYQCWFDENDSLMFCGEVTNGLFLLDASSVNEGFHRISLLVADEYTSSNPEFRYFVKVPQTMNVDYLECLLFVNDTLYMQESFAEEGGAIHMDFDVSRLNNGLHHLKAMVATPTGARSKLHEAFFYRMPKQNELEQLKLVYYINNDTTKVQTGTLSNGKYEFMLDVSELENGVHQLGCHLTDERGNISDIRNYFFVKMADNSDGICQYEYWVNDSIQKKQSSELEEPQNPFKLVSMLPLESQPIRTENFYFLIEKGTPRIYGRNTLYMRFMDTDLRITETEHPYIDMAGSQDVIPVGALQPYQEFETVQDGNIRWYSLHAQVGDSISFKSSLPCTLQLFSPLSVETYKVQSNASTEFGGCIVSESGIYYLAIHDVTGKETEMSIEFEHFDKDGNVSAIEHLESTMENETLYDLSGRRIVHPQSGVLVKKGQKILYNK